ncbi:class IIb bacteriocin, lactobin A/cerein 7B family [Spirosoma sp. RP8]|uniref:Class IIb bacteriocin, lactobin A/cerein 7B family n=1 Tax=Spirosoma liriopis TaxID=2937440 RepID=A0ABT0HUZ5_9BACT|nr:class IIb bacteriocin, lactobin A/cerein 7B family [Spirosoma liriopis]MCK8496019.1 class IIb bacteriocin, lactobin A/cerein 7B family [Spirosoma liriopis]
MVTFENQKKGLDVVNELIEKSFKNSSFKSDLLDNPHAAIEALYGTVISKEVNIVVEDQSDPAYIYINIPAKPNLDEVELTDEQLEMVSGGEVLASVGVGALIVGAGLLGAAIGYGICKAID